MVRLNIVSGIPAETSACKTPTRRRFRVIEGTGQGSLGTQEHKFTPKPSDAARAFNMLEAQMEGENWFLKEVRALIRYNDGIADPEQPLDAQAYPHLTSKTGHDNLIHIAQFFFLLDAWSITKPEQIEEFIQGHNDKIDDLIQNRTTNMTVSELRKVIFKSSRKAQVVDTFQYYKRPVFAISEIGYFLFYVMSPGTTTNIINDLIDAGIMTRLNPEGAPGATDPRRILVEPTLDFKTLYMQSLLKARALIQS